MHRLPVHPLLALPVSAPTHPNSSRGQKGGVPERPQLRCAGIPLGNGVKLAGPSGHAKPRVSAQSLLPRPQALLVRVPAHLGTTRQRK